MKKRVPKKAKRRFFALTALLIIVISFFVGTIFQDWVQIVENKRQLFTLHNKYDELLSDWESLNSEVVKLHDSEYVARYAREKYMYSLPNEIIIKIPGSSN